MSSDLCASCPHPNSPVVPDGSDGCSRCRTCILRDCTSTISKTSRDGSVSLVDDDLPVVNFDSVKECYCKKVNGGCNSRAPPMRCIAIGKRYI